MSEVKNNVQKDGKENLGKEKNISQTMKKTNVMYIGPSIAGVIRYSTVFKDGVLSEKVQECIKELPIMEKLFVPIEEVVGAFKELKTKQSVLSVIFDKTQEKFRS